jgi:hypothetical protein
VETGNTPVPKSLPKNDHAVASAAEKESVDGKDVGIANDVRNINR